jgi:hypothetical protein
MNFKMSSKFGMLLFGLTLAACGPQGTQGIWIDAPVESAALTEGTHSVSVHANWDGDVSMIGIIFETPGYSYGKYALPPGEEIDGELYLANFEQVTETAMTAEIPFPFLMVGLPQPEYTLRACLFGPLPEWELLTCSEITVYMPNCGPGEVSLGPDCIPAAVDATPTANFILDEILVVPNRNVNCRLGPSATLFEIDDTLMEGVEYKPLAQGPDAMWLLFEGPISKNNCWAFAENLDVVCNDGQAGDLESCGLEVVDYPPLPTLSSTPTFTPEADSTEVPQQLPQCSDGLDNDGDGDIDMADGRCVDPNDDTENS